MPYWRNYGNHREIQHKANGGITLAGAAVTFFLFSNVAAADFSWVSRPDPMQVHMLADADRKGDTVRVLYQSMPSLQQAASGGWTVNVYLAELHADGRIENRMLASGQRNFSALVLQRGGDSVFAVPRPERRSDPVTLETWSARDGALRASFSAPALAAAGGTTRSLFPTDDGHFYTVAQSAQSSRGDQPTTITWTKMSPEGEVLARGEWSNPTALSSLGGAFPVANGGMGLALNLRLVRDAEALETDIEAIQQFEIGGRTIEARVFSESRLLAADASGAWAWVSPALERDLMWSGEMAIPQDLPMNEMLAQNAEQMALMRNVTLELGGERQILHQATFGYDDVQATPGGYGMLAKVTADRSLEPPQHGTWFLEVGRDGGLLREQRIEPAAERLEATFERFLPTADGGLLVAGSRRAGDGSLHLTVLAPDGAVEWTARLAAENVQLEGIAGSEAVPWVFGQGWNQAHGKNLMWAERVDPASAQRLATEAAAPDRPSTPRAQPRPRAAPEPAAAPTLELPKPAEGCACTCEEFAEIQELSERMKSASQAQVIAMTSDPAFQARMNCMSGCAMAYAQCR